jgi:hypothetical protein
MPVASTAQPCGTAQHRLPQISRKLGWVQIVAHFDRDLRVSAKLLRPAGANRLAGTSPTALSSNPKGAVQVTLPDGQNLQAEF